MGRFHIHHPMGLSHRQSIAEMEMGPHHMILGSSTERYHLQDIHHSHDSSDPYTHIIPISRILPFIHHSYTSHISPVVPIVLPYKRHRRQVITVGGLATFVAALADPAFGVPMAFAIAIHNIPEGAEGQGGLVAGVRDGLIYTYLHIHR